MSPSRKTGFDASILPTERKGGNYLTGNARAAQHTLGSPHDPRGAGRGHGHRTQPEIVVPLRYRADQGELSFISMTAVVGTPLDITVEELAIESFYPADEATAAALRARA